MGQCNSSILSTTNVSNSIHSRMSTDSKKGCTSVTSCATNGFGESSKSTTAESSKQDISLISLSPLDICESRTSYKSFSSCDGISLAGIKEFLKAHRSELSNLSTSTVFSTLIDPITNSQKISYCDHLRNNGN